MILVLATDVFSIGGIQRYTRYQIQALRSYSWLDKIVVFSLCSENKNDSLGGKFMVDYVFGGTDFFSKIRFSLKAIIFVIKEKPNLVLCNHISFSFIVRLIKKITGVPYIFNVYGMEIWSGLSSGRIKGLKQAKAIISDCKFTIKYVKDNFGISEDKIFLLYDCVDLGKFYPQIVPRVIYEKYGINKNKKIISVVGRLAYDKGQKTMISFLKYLPDNIILVLVGGGSKLKEWKKFAELEGIEKRVIFTGYVPEEDLVFLYNIANLIVYLSKFKKNEGGALPLVLIEAGACEKPIIVSDEDGATEAVKNGFNGFIVPTRNKEAVIGKIKYFFSNPQILKEISRNSRKYVERNFSYKIFNKKQEDIIKGILK
ncbi:glycosyltransferase family 4 protein [Candidatus Wolfebacteria bacterium]|nr:glycosyltransferase family 4 protein [Candidatus Wolfebacteria bacterium]